MEDQQKVRLIILAVSGLLFGAGGYSWYLYQENKKAAEVDDQPVVSVRLPVRKKPIGTAGSTSLTSSGTTPNGATVPAINVRPRITPDTVAAVTAAAKNQIASAPTQTTAVTTTATTPVATKTPAVTKTPAAATTAPTATATTTPRAVPVATTTTAATATATTAATTDPAVPAQPTATAPTTGPNGNIVYTATPRPDASAVAKQGAGRQDPAQPISSFLPFPGIHGKAGSMLANNNTDALLALVPPPPPSTDTKPKKPVKINEKLVPPPPPVQSSAGDALAGLPIDQLPVPPSRPTIGDKLKVLGIFDDKAILAFPKAMSQKNKWPRTLTLGTGEQFESLTVVSITRDGITIEEDGERTLKPIATIK